MAEVAEEWFVIDDRLRLALFGLECALGVSFNGIECERVFQDARADQISRKQYNFFTSASLIVVGRVDEYEPETICIQLRSTVRTRDLLKRVKDGAELHYYRLRQAAQ